jgi:LPS O-antigen subunit length determinant protein (WzzB/FepE family)
VEMDTAKAAFKHRYIVVTPAQMPRKPAKPYTALTLIGGLLGGAALAFFASVVADLRTGRVIETWQVERKLRLSVLAELGP